MSLVFALRTLHVIDSCYIIAILTDPQFPGCVSCHMVSCELDTPRQQLGVQVSEWPNDHTFQVKSRESTGVKRRSFS
jgi:hypothetical protein